MTLQLTTYSARALKFLRRKNLIHRDIKPQVRDMILSLQIVLRHVVESSFEPGLGARHREWTSPRRAHFEDRRLRLCTLSFTCYDGGDLVRFTVSIVRGTLVTRN